MAACGIKHLDLFELCPANLDRAKANVNIGDAAIGYFDVDLNFAELPHNTYGFILSRFFLHHIVNLEHLLHHVNRALAPDGIFVLYDYVGESRYRWPPSKVQYVNRLLERLKHLGVVGYPLGEHPGDILTAPDRSDRFQTLVENSPFETIRAGDITAALDAQFSDSRLFEVRYGALVHSAFRTLDFSMWEDPRLNEAVNVFVHAERELATATFNPCGIFGVYGKSPTRVTTSPRWTEQYILSELA